MKSTIHAAYRWMPSVFAAVIFCTALAGPTGAQAPTQQPQSQAQAGMPVLPGQTAAPEQPKIGDFANRIELWTMDVPVSVFGFDKLGVRRGAYTMHINVDGRSADIPISPRMVSNNRPSSKDWFAKWKVEDELRNLANTPGTPIIVKYTAKGDGLIDVTDVQAAKGGEAVDNNGTQYLTSGKTPLEAKDQIYVDNETMTIVGIFLALVIPAYILLLVTRKNLGNMG